MTREEAIKWLKDYIQNTPFQMEQYERAFEMAIKALEQEQDMTIAYLMGKYEDKEPCDAISREAVLNIFVPYRLAESKIAEEVKSLPSVTPSRPCGRWAKSFNDTEGEVRFYCSECGMWEYFETDYCPNCGADMRGVE